MKSKTMLLMATTFLISSVLASSTPERVPGSFHRLPDSVPGSESSASSHDTRSQIFTRKQRGFFREQGFLVASGLLDEEIEDLQKAGDALLSVSKTTDSYFSLVDMGVLFRSGHDNTTNTRAFRKVALESILPQAVAELLDLPENSSLRVLRDVFMSKSVASDKACDWHVDDVGFWPESFVSEKDGVNVWIAMQDMPASYQGSMALSPGSHKADWRFEAYEAIGQNRTYHGGFTKEDIIQHVESGKTLLSTCDMHRQAPEIRDYIEETKFVPDIKKGDVIFATRSLFHRTLPVTPAGKQYYSKHGIEHLNRYSVRYVPGTARLPKGWTFEWSIAENKNIAGGTLDSAMGDQVSLIWYPKVWPSLEPECHEKLDVIATSFLDDMRSKTNAELFELISLLSMNQ